MSDEQQAVYWQLRVDGAQIASVHAGTTVEIGRKPIRPLASNGMTRVEIDDPARSMSKRHAVFAVLTDGTATLRDMHSTNGSYIVRSDGALARLPLNEAIRMPDDTVRVQFGDVPVDFLKFVGAQHEQKPVTNLFSYAADSQQTPDGSDMSVDDILNLRAGEPTDVFDAGSVRARARQIRKAERQSFPPLMQPVEPVIDEVAVEEEAVVQPRDLFMDALADTRPEHTESVEPSVDQQAAEQPEPVVTPNADANKGNDSLVDNESGFVSIDAIASHRASTPRAHAGEVAAAQYPQTQQAHEDAIEFGEPVATDDIAQRMHAADEQVIESSDDEAAEHAVEQVAQTASQADMAQTLVDLDNVNDQQDVARAEQLMQQAQADMAQVVADIELEDRMQDDVQAHEEPGWQDAGEATQTMQPIRVDDASAAISAEQSVDAMQQAQDYNPQSAYEPTEQAQMHDRFRRHQADETTQFAFEAVDDHMNAPTEDMSRFAPRGDEPTRNIIEEQAQAQHIETAFEPGSVFAKVAQGQFEQQEREAQQMITAGGYTSDQARLSDDFGEQFEMAKHEELLPFLAMNPSLYDDLYVWLAAQGDADIDDALANNVGYEEYRKAVGK